MQAGRGNVTRRQWLAMHMDLIFPLVHESKDKGGRVQVSKQYQRKDQAKTLIMIAKEKG